MRFEREGPQTRSLRWNLKDPGYSWGYRKLRDPRNTKIRSLVCLNYTRGPSSGVGNGPFSSTLRDTTDPLVRSGMEGFSIYVRLPYPGGEETQVPGRVGPTSSSSKKESSRTSHPHTRHTTKFVLPDTNLNVHWYSSVKPQKRLLPRLIPLPYPQIRNGRSSQFSYGETRGGSRDSLSRGFLLEPRKLRSLNSLSLLRPPTFRLLFRKPKGF